MFRSRSKGSLEIPANASQYRSSTILKAAAEKANGQPVSSKKESSEEEDGKSLLLNDSVLLSPGKSFSPKGDDVDFGLTPRKIRRECQFFLKLMNSEFYAL